MISDFLLHPAMDLDESLRQRFIANILGQFREKGLARRVELVYPLFGLKWCLIFLNEYLPEHLLRRGFASGGRLNKAELQAEQLSKARRMLDKIRRDYEYFPYYA